MPNISLHSQYLIQCPKNVDPTLVKPEGFREFIPPNVNAVELKGLTLKQSKNTCIWELTVTLPGDAEAYNDPVQRYNLRDEIDKYKPRNTNLLAEKKAVRNGDTYWIFDYQVVGTEVAYIESLQFFGVYTKENSVCQTVIIELFSN